MSLGYRALVPTRAATSLALAGMLLVIGGIVPGSALAMPPASAKTKTVAATPGDWEASGPGRATASFEIVGVGERGGAKRRLLEDFAIDAPISCTNTSGPAIPYDVEVIDGPLGVKNGKFSGGSVANRVETKLSGRFAGTQFILSYRHESQVPNQFAGGTEVCDTGTIRLTATLGHRELVKDGIWRGTTQTIFWGRLLGYVLGCALHRKTSLEICVRVTLDASI